MYFPVKYVVCCLTANAAMWGLNGADDESGLENPISKCKFIKFCFINL